MAIFILFYDARQLHTTLADKCLVNMYLFWHYYLGDGLFRRNWRQYMQYYLVNIASICRFRSSGLSNRRVYINHRALRTELWNVCYMSKHFLFYFNHLLPSAHKSSRIVKILILKLEGTIKKISYQRRDYDSVDEKSLSYATCPKKQNSGSKGLNMFPVKLQSVENGRGSY